MEQKNLQVKNKLEDYILTIDDESGFLVSDSIIKVCKKYPEKFGQGAIVGNNNSTIDKKIRDTLIWVLGSNIDDMISMHWGQYISYIFRRSLKFYRQYTKENHDVILTDISILKYGKNGHYKVHHDHHRKFPRTLSFIMFLNDDYEGGDLKFHFPDEKNIHTINKKRGRIVIFPSNFLYKHTVEPVKEGTRYSIVAWML